MKQRFSQIDVSAVVSQLHKTLVNKRLVNIYDIDKRKYLLKFGTSEDKSYVVIESGIRIHSTKFKRDKMPSPSPFISKIRNFIKARRVVSITQLGSDRVVDFNFGSHHLCFEFYSKGNVLLTDENYQIVAVLRQHKFETEDLMTVGTMYDLARRRKHTDIENDVLKMGIWSGLVAAIEKKKEDSILKYVLNRCTVLGPDVVEHVLVKAGFTSKSRVADLMTTSDDETYQSSSLGEEYTIFPGDEKIEPIEGYHLTFWNKQKIDRLHAELQEADKILHEIEEKTPKGYILLKGKNKEALKKLEDKEEQRQFYSSFMPYPFAQNKENVKIEFNTFDEAIDEFYSSIEASKIESRKENLEEAMHKKINQIKREQRERIQHLDAQIEMDERRAELLQSHVNAIEKVIKFVQDGLEAKVKWEEMENVVKNLKKQPDCDAFVHLIQRFKFEKQQVVVALTDDAEVDPINVPVDYTLTVHQNITNYYNEKKNKESKKEKTLASQKKAFARGKKMAIEKYKKAERQTKTNIAQFRKKFWFEKFYWMITSENYLVIAGRDAQTNEIVVKKHLRKGDIYIHADIHGAASVIIKNHKGASQPIPQQSIVEAAQMATCRSKAWESKIGGTVTYWVHAHQVSKTAQSGEYLSTGSFMVRGKKNFLPSLELNMGVGILFKVDETSIANHRDGELEESERRLFESQHDAVMDDLHEDSPMVAFDKDKELFNETETSSSDDEEEEEEEEEKDESKKPSSAELDKKIEDTKNSFKNLSHSEIKKRFNVKDKRLHRSFLKKMSEEEAVAAVVAEKIDKKVRKIQNEFNARMKAFNAPSKPSSSSQSSSQSSSRKLSKKKRRAADRYSEMSKKEREIASALVGKQEHLYVEQKEKPEDRELSERIAVQEAAKKKRAEMERQQYMLNENIPFLTDKERLTLKEADALVSNPHPNDVILFALPVCAPYPVVNTFKYFVRLTPGSLKRGKAAKEIHNILLHETNNNINDLKKADSSDPTPDAPSTEDDDSHQQQLLLAERESEAIRKIANEDYVHSLVGNSKVISSDSTNKKSRKINRRRRRGGHRKRK